MDSNMDGRDESSMVVGSREDKGLRFSRYREDVSRSNVWVSSLPEGTDDIFLREYGHYPCSDESFYEEARAKVLRLVVSPLRITRDIGRIVGDTAGSSLISFELAWGSLFRV